MDKVLTISTGASIKRLNSSLHSLLMMVLILLSVSTENAQSTRRVSWVVLKKQQPVFTDCEQWLLQAI
jgi:hypothetical protein